MLSGSRLHDWNALRTERARGWFVGRQRQRHERPVRYAEVNRSAAAINDRRGPDHHSPALPGDLHGLAGGTACRENILDDEHAFARVDREAAPQLERTRRRPLSKE